MHECIYLGMGRSWV